MKTNESFKKEVDLNQLMDEEGFKEKGDHYIRIEDNGGTAIVYKESRRIVAIGNTKAFLKNWSKRNLLEVF